MKRLMDADIYHHSVHGSYVDANAVGSFMDKTPYFVVDDKFPPRNVERRGWKIRDVAAELEQLIPSLKGSERETAEENLRFLEAKLDQI